MNARLFIRQEFLHRRSARPLSTGSPLLSGHSRWAKIKHDKGSADDAKAKQRAALSQELTLASKRTPKVLNLLVALLMTCAPAVHGTDPLLNPRLSTLITAAKKSGFPKHSIEHAIARGQGISPSGAALEDLLIEFMLPASGTAALVECQTDNKSRTRQDVAIILKSFGATITPTAYMFERRGRLVFEAGTGLSEDKVFEAAVDAGAVDVKVDEGSVVVFTEPGDLAAVAEKLAESVGHRPVGTLIWVAKDGAAVNIKDKGAKESLERLSAELEEEPSVQEIYLNAD